MGRRIPCIILSIVILLSSVLGCQTKDSPGEMGSEIWTQMPLLTYGDMQGDKIEKLTWNSGRCEAISCNMMAETEKGYYLIYASWLWYADKSNLGNWIIVCNEPDCKHLDGNCQGHISSNGFFIKDQQIYYSGLASDVPQLLNSNVGDPVLVSMDADGTNKTARYKLAEVKQSGEGSVANYLLPDQWLVASSVLDTAGKFQSKLFCITQDGCEQFFSSGDGPAIVTILGAKNVFTLYGDKYFCCNLLDDTGTKIFRFLHGDLITHDVAGLPLRGGYLSGDTLRCFRPGDGYYDIDIATRKEVRLSDAQLQNSYSAVILPNCILESTLLYPVSSNNRTEGMSHSIVIFDGESWRGVDLPEELRHASESFYITVQTVTSDGILLACRDSRTVYKTTGTVYYYIRLSEENLFAEYWTEIILPKED